MKRELTLSVRSWPLEEPFVISRETLTTAAALIVKLEANGRTGHGEARGVSYHGETAASCLAQVESIRSELEAGAERKDLLTLLPPGGARNAVDAALWDLEAKQTGISPWQAAEIAPTLPIVSAFTIGIRSPAEYETRARQLADWPWIKVKVGSEAPLEAVAAVRRGAPRSRLVVDANQAWSVAQLEELAPRLADLKVELLEQPVAAEIDAPLRDLELPIPVCADEPFDTVADLARVVDRYDFVNIKLDKAGGLTAALETARAARAAGMRLMVGCMTGSSLAMAPAMVLAQLCEVVDLDGPLLLADDWPDPIHYDRGRMSIPSPRLWG